MDNACGQMGCIRLFRALVLRELFHLGLTVAVLLFLMFLGLYALGRLSRRKDSLTLDLNELRHAAAEGLRHVSWSDVYAVTPGRPCWIRVKLEDGSLLRVCVPQNDRDTLVGIMQQLIRHHHGHLHGLESGNGPQDPA